MKIPGRKKGLTLAETMVAVAILAFALCGILATFVSSMGLVVLSKNIGIATNAAQAVMEEIRSVPFNQIIPQYDGLQFTVNNLPQSLGAVSVDDTNPELLNVTVSVCWRQGNRVIGEDQNLDGILTPAEDVNHNGIIDSPAEITTIIANRQD